jgi:hypothetical protein
MRRRQARLLSLLVMAIVGGLVVASAGDSRAETIRAEDAGAHVGEEVVVEGHVANVVCSPLACLLSFTTDFSGLVASIPGDAVGAFPPPKETYGARRVQVRGTIGENAGRPRIELRDPQQIEVLETAVGVKEANAAEAARGEVAGDPQPLSGDVPAETAPPTRASRVVQSGQFEKRLGPPRERGPAAEGDGLVSELRRGGGEATVELRALRDQIARLEETARTLADTVAALEERITVLEQTRGPGVDPSALPQLRPYVVSGDGSTRLQPVKRGWSSERVLRAYGAPLNTSTEANGYVTWYYGNGRAVTIDPRGRVSSSVGF